MKKKYNIAFTPLSEAEIFVQRAASFASIADTYHLGKKSLPHVTLRHFFADEADIEGLWKQACESLAPHRLILTFQQFNEYTNDGMLFWLSMLPDHRDTLEDMHRIVAKVVGAPADPNYDSHLTLANTRKPYKKLLQTGAAKIQPITAPFILTLGDCDKAGQMTQIIFQTASN